MIPASHFDPTPASHHELDTAVETSGQAAKRDRKKRLQLSCHECRKKKLACDRNLPCRRCVRAGRAYRCCFEAGPDVLQQQQQQQQQSSDEVQRLRAEVARLKTVLSKTSCQHDETVSDVEDAANTNELSHPINRSPRAYYSEHSLLKFFTEIPQLFPFIRETAEECLKPAGVRLKKTPVANPDVITKLQEFLPPKEDSDRLAAFFLDHVAPVYHIIHIPSFKRGYANLWTPGAARHPAVAALVLSMIAISVCVSGDLVSNKYRTMPISWISACDKWLAEQSPEHRKLAHYQVSVLVYLGKRINTIEKKKFWFETSALVQRAILDGLHRDPSTVTDSPFMGEMKRRLWAVIRELDLQNSFEFGQSTLLHNIDSNAAAPANTDDEAFDDTSATLPEPRPSKQHTFSSYLSLSARSFQLRLEVSRRLFSPGCAQVLSYDEVLRYTHELTQAMHDLPSEDSESTTAGKLIVYALLNCQVMVCIIAMHRPYLKRGDAKYWLSENITYQMARDILLLNLHISGSGIGGLTFIREDLLLVSLTMARITLLQPLGSTSIIATGADSTVTMLEQCLPLMEERYLRCCPGEPWCPITMYAIILLLKIHGGTQSWQAAKLVCGQRYLELHSKSAGGRLQRQPASQNSLPTEKMKQQHLPTPGTDASMILEGSDWSSANYPEPGLDAFDLAFGTDGSWDWLGNEAAGASSGTWPLVL